MRCRSAPQQNRLISKAGIASPRRAGAVGDTIGKFLDALGPPLPSDLNRRTLASVADDLPSDEAILLTSRLVTDRDVATAREKG